MVLFGESAYNKEHKGSGHLISRKLLHLNAKNMKYIYNLTYAAHVQWAVNNGIVMGYEDGTFGPDRPINREEMAAILRVM